MYWHLYWEILRSIISDGLDRGDVSEILGTVPVLLEVVGLPEQFDTFLLENPPKNETVQA